MTIKQAITQLLKSDEFKERAKKEARLRVYKGRLQKEGVKSSAAIELLKEFGYKIEVIKK